MSMPTGATAIEDENEDLLRQVHPTQFKANGQPDSSAFCPSPRDESKMSTRRAKVGAEGAHSEWVALGRLSAGTWSVRQTDLPDEIIAYDDSGMHNNPPGHASVDFGSLSRSRQQKEARKLRDASHQRGCLFGWPPFAS